MCAATSNVRHHPRQGCRQYDMTSDFQFMFPGINWSIRPRLPLAAFASDAIRQFRRNDVHMKPRRRLQCKRRSGIAMRSGCRWKCRSPSPLCRLSLFCSSAPVRPFVLVRLLASMVWSKLLGGRGQRLQMRCPGNGLFILASLQLVSQSTDRR